MKRENLAFLIGGFAFGILFGYALFKALEHRPGAVSEQAAARSASVPAPAGPPAPTQIAGGAPMTQEINELKRRVQSNPGDINALLRLARLYSAVGMWDQADGFYDRAVEADPANSDLRRGLAHLYYDAQRWERAVTYYRMALEATPNDPDLLTDMGICYKELGEYEKALELFGRANQFDPNHWQSLYNTAVVAGFDLGRYDEAEAALRRLEQVRPGAPEAQRLREALLQSRRRGGTGGRP